MITETYVGSGANSDILSGTSRLRAMPFAASVSVEASAQKCTSANNVTLSIREPDGDVPMDAQIVPGGTTDGDELVLSDLTEVTYETQILMGAHLVLSVGVTGTTEWIVRVTAQEAA